MNDPELKGLALMLVVIASLLTAIFIDKTLAATFLAVGLKYLFDRPNNGGKA